MKPLHLIKDAVPSDDFGLICDNFAGGGGASTGIEAALGRAVNYAINHDEEAIRMHAANHPGTVHIRNNIWQVDPVDIVKGRRVRLAWFSPDCKHFSKAKGGKPRDKAIRDLAWVVVVWAQRVKPEVILLENVEEFQTWGPLDEEGYPIKARAGETFRKWCNQLRRAGYKIQFRELRACDYGAPTIRKRFFMIARRDGKPIVWPKPTHGKPGTPDVLRGKLLPWRTAAEIIDWSIPCPSIFDRKKPLADKTLRRIAHGIMKFVINNQSPFIVPLTHHGSDGRSYGLDNPLPTVTGANRGEMALVSPHITKFRSGAIGHGVDEPMHTVTANSYIKRPGGSAPLGVVEAAIAPFATYAQQGGANRSAGEPLHTVTASNKDQNCIAAAHLVHIGNGEREGQAPRAMDVERPLGTVVAGETKHHAVMAFMQKFASGNAPTAMHDPTQTVEGKGKHSLVCAHIMQANSERKGIKAGRSAEEPLSTVTITGSQQQIVTSHLIKLRGTCAHGQPVSEPLHTVSAGGTHMGEIRAFLVKYYGNEPDGTDLDKPLGTVTVNDRFGLVTVTVAGEEYVIVDIGMRMLTPRELFNAQGFPAGYIIDRDADGNPITKTAQVAKCGNSVCPDLAEALTRAQFPEECAQTEERIAA